MQGKLSEDVKGSSLASLFALEARSNLFPPVSHRAQSSCIFREAASKDDNKVVSLEDDIEFTVVEKGVEISGGNLSTRAHIFHQFQEGSFSEVGNHGHELYVPAFSSSTQTSRHIRGSDEDLKLVSLVLAAESELKAMKITHSKIQARILDDAEAEALMQKWGLKENNFQNSPPDASGELHNPINSSILGFVHLPALAKDLGSVVSTKERGLLRKMNHMLSNTNKSNGRLIMQGSKPQEMPVQRDLSAVDILHSLASFGAENLTMQAEE